VNFGLPNLQGRVPIHMGAGFTLGQQGGEQAHTLTTAELPTHTHVLNATSNNGTAIAPATNLLAGSPNQFYQVPNAMGQRPTAMSPSTVANVGGTQAHLNMQPFLVLSFCIALQGIFPSQT